MNVKPKTYTKLKPLRFTDKQWAGARTAAKALGVTPTVLVRMALTDFLKRCSIDVREDV